jgi:hypothetical protein
VPESDRVQRDPERLEQGDVVIGDRVGHRHEQPTRPRHPLAQAPIRDAVPREADVLAEVAVPRAADVAVAAGVARLERDALSRPPSGLDDAADLVAEHQRSRQARARATVLVPVKVRSAETDRGDAHQLLARSWHWLMHRLEAKVADGVESQCIHRPPR